MPRSRFISVTGNLDGDALIEALAAKYPKFRANAGRWFVDSPLHDENTTWVLSKMWGRQTTTVLDNLLELAPSDDFGYRAV